MSSDEIRVPEVGGALSRAALLHAQELATDDPHTLAMALYRYNQIPITPFWRARFAGPEAVLMHVGADRGALRATLRRHWTRSSNGWLLWTSRHAPDLAPYKLYVSPRPDRIRDAFDALVRVLTVVPATFKMGSGAAGLLRPDKLAAYFATRDELEEAAARMRCELGERDAHGVPFTASLDESGLLSWGVDPHERMSWRLWIAQHLGAAMAVAKTNGAPEPWKLAAARLERLGVDVATWSPS